MWFLILTAANSRTIMARTNHNPDTGTDYEVQFVNTATLNTQTRQLTASELTSVVAFVTGAARDNPEFRKYVDDLNLCYECNPGISTPEERAARLRSQLGLSE